MKEKECLQSQIKHLKGACSRIKYRLQAIKVVVERQRESVVWPHHRISTSMEAMHGEKLNQVVATQIQQYKQLVKLQMDHQNYLDTLLR